MKEHLKPLGYVIAGLLALVGFASSALLVFYIVVSLRKSPNGYTGEDCGKSLVHQYIPLPPQEEKHMPMVLDKLSLNADAGVIIFRAPQEWQETFRHFYPGEHVKDAHMAETAALAWSADLPDKRIHYFVKKRRWLPFHTGRIRGQNFSALRDESGQYLLVYIYKP